VDAKKWMGRKEIARRIGISPQTLSRWVREGLFPPADLRERRKVVRWAVETVERWEAERLTSSEAIGGRGDVSSPTMKEVVS
jgi:predicted site-specific integrase-resolvase